MDPTPADPALVFRLVAAFHRAGGQPAPSTPTCADAATRRLRARLRGSEIREARDAAAAGDPVAAVHEATDVAYVLAGDAVACGVADDAARWLAILRPVAGPDRLDDWPSRLTTVANLAAEVGDAQATAADPRESARPLALAIAHTRELVAGLGVDPDAAFAEVHRANMAKVAARPPRTRDDGKVLKPDGFRPADLAPLFPHDTAQRHAAA